RRDLAIDDEDLFDFYDQRVDPQVVSAAHFDRWWKRVRHRRPKLLHLREDQLLRDGARVAETDYPDTWTFGQLSFPLTYQFEPGQAADGVTVDLPLAALDPARGAGFDWQVPGLRQELVVALLRSLPKPLRRQLVPLPEVAADALAKL